MKNILRALILAGVVLNPLAAQAHHNADRHRAECIFSFGLAKESCKRGFDGDSFGKVAKELDQEIVDDFTKHYNATAEGKIRKLVADVATPGQILFTFEFSGNGVTAIYKTKDKIERVSKGIKDGTFQIDQDIFTEVFPDELRVKVGLDLSLVLTVKAEVTIVYEVHDDIVEIFKVLDEL